jgi:hypothetical protein
VPVDQGAIRGSRRNNPAKPCGFTLLPAKHPEGFSGDRRLFIAFLNADFRASAYTRNPASIGRSQWRDPDSNRGHHDFQTFARNSLTGPKGPADKRVEPRVSQHGYPQIPFLPRDSGDARCLIAFADSPGRTPSPANAGARLWPDRALGPGPKRASRVPGLGRSHRAGSGSAARLRVTCGLMLLAKGSDGVDSARTAWRA